MSSADSDCMILVVDDEAAVRRTVRTALEMRGGFCCLEAADVSEAERQISGQKLDLILLDWMLSGVSGLDFLRRIRSRNKYCDLPVIMLTARDAERNMVRGLEQGADDYITKPFSPRELVARIHAVLRRRGTTAENAILSVGKLQLDPAQKSVFFAGRELKLRPMEYRLLYFLMEHPRQTYSRSALLEQIWDPNSRLEERTLDVHISRLRRALKNCGDCSSWLQTVSGFGYCFAPPAD